MSTDVNGAPIIRPKSKYFYPDERDRDFNHCSLSGHTPLGGIRVETAPSDPGDVACFCGAVTWTPHVLRTSAIPEPAR